MDFFLLIFKPKHIYFIKKYRIQGIFTYLGLGKLILEFDYDT